jgi:hypothetical protein
MTSSLHVPPDVVSLIVHPDHPILTVEVAGKLGLTTKAADEYLGRLARQQRLARRGKGVFTAPRQGRPKLVPTRLLKRASAVLGHELPMTPVVGWTTEWLASYAHNVPVHHWTVLEAASFALTAVADILARDRLRAVINPPSTEMLDLLRLFERPLILWPHGDMYAAPHRLGLRLPEPERLVVDIYFAVTRRGLPYPRNDLDLVIARFVAERDLNIASILAYSKRRRIDSEMASYLRSLNRLPPDVTQAIALVTSREPERDADG